MRRSAYVHALGADQLELLRPVRPAKLVLPFLLICAWSAVLFVMPSSPLTLTLLCVGVVLLPVVMVRAFRQFRARRNVLVRAPGRLLLDGEPLEVARIELRVLKHWLFRTPRGYALSLWALIGRGEPLDVELGRFQSMLDASLVSGQMEDFLERAKQRAKGPAAMGD
jgi:hypothetical protein